MIAWLGAALALAVWLLCAITNASLLLRQGKPGDHVPSPVPLLGGLAGALAVAWLPWPVPHRLAWLLVPALLDVGSLPLLILTAWALRNERKRP